MNTQRTAFVVLITAFFACAALADDAAPALPLSKAAKLAEDAIASAALPADCFLRSLTLVQTPDAAPYYRATYKPPVTRRVQVGTEPPLTMIDFIRIAMDGKVSFEQEEMRSRRTIQAK